MIDRNELRRLAQAYPNVPEHGESVAEFIRRRREAFLDFKDAANPTAVLELLDEIERLRAVFEAARAVLRYGGPERFGKAWHELDKAVKAALLADQGGE